MRHLSRIGLLLSFIVVLNSPGVAQSGIITTYAGPAMPVSGGLAIDQVFDCLVSVSSDRSGGFYLSCADQHRIYRVLVDGTLSIVAGDGTRGFSGDGGPAISARLNHPRGMAVDTAGNLFIADSSNHRIRKVTPDGVIGTVAGIGTGGFSGDGGLAISAQLNYPNDVAVDSTGNLYVVDGHVRKVTAAGIISTVAGSEYLAATGGITVDASGNLYVTDDRYNRILKLTPDGIVSTVAGDGTKGFAGDGGPATSAQLDIPVDVAVDGEGNLYIADWANNRIRKVTTAGIISTVAGDGTYEFGGDGGPANASQLAGPQGVAVDEEGNLYIADRGSGRVRKVTTAGIISTVAGDWLADFRGDGGPVTSARFLGLAGLTVDPGGSLYIADSWNNRIRKVTAAGIINTVAGNGTRGFGGDGGPAISAQLYSPVGIAVDASGNLYIADQYNFRIRKVTPAGIISTVAGDGTPGFSGDGGPAVSAQLNVPLGIAVDGLGNLYIADSANNRIRKVTAAGIISTVAGNGSRSFNGDGGPAASAQLNPVWVASDASGNLYIADSWNDRIRKVTTAGIISTVAGNGTWGFSGDDGPSIYAKLSTPVGVAVDASGNIYIGEQFYRIRKVTATGIITTVAGDGTPGFSGDGGPATSAQLRSPSGMVVDASGSLYIADSQRIRKVTGGPTVSTDFTLSAGGVANSLTTGEAQVVQAGYGVLDVKSGTIPYGTAVLSFKQNGVTVSEAGVPASLPTTLARTFIDYRSAVPAVPGRIEAGTIDVNTGIAVVNLGSETANVTYLLRNLMGTTLSSGHGTIDAGTHFAKFIDQMKDVASGFRLPSDFQRTTQFGSLEISSDQPLSIVALRMTTNQKNEVLFTTTPVADLTQSLAATPMYFPQFADGGGYTTSLILLNTSNVVETGTFQILDNQGAPLIVNQVGSTADSSFKYSVAPGGAFCFQTDGFPVTTKVGWVQLTPDDGTSTPAGAGVFSYNPGNVLVTESGIPAAASTTHARVYVDLSGGHNTGLAIANLAETSASISIKAIQGDGTTGVGTSQGPLPLPAKGHGAKFAGEFVTGLPSEFTGVLDIRSATPFAALTMRSLTNERGDFLLTTFPIADANRAAPSPIVFPQIADGGGYVTQFILLSPGGASSGRLNFYGETGAPLAVGK